MPRIPVAELRLDMPLRKQTFLLRDKSIIPTRVGDPLRLVTLVDRTGSITGAYRDGPGRPFDSLVEGQGVEVTGRVGEHKDQLQINIERIAPVELTQLEEFLPIARRPMDEMKAELEALWASVEQPDLARLLDTLLGDPATYAAFTKAPAAKRYHHACIGGLLEHTLSVARIALTACDLYPELNRDLIITVALLHDWGKIRTYDPLSFAITEEGSLWTHLYMGASLVEHAIDTLPNFDSELRLRIVHAILAHHGSLERGSPVVPMTLEAIVLHYADNLDGDARGFIDHLEREPNESGSFTAHSSMHDTRLYRGSQDLE